MNPREMQARAAKSRRQSSRNAVRKALADGPLTRYQIAKRIGRAPNTVSSILREIGAREAGRSEPERGAPAKLWRLA